MGKENREFYTELRDGFFSNSEIVLDDPGAVLVGDRMLCPVVTELVNNCLDKGARRVIVTVKTGRIIVEDDVRHPDEDILVILDNIQKEWPKTSKKVDPDSDFPVGGVGIMSVRKTLRDRGGSLSYEVVGNGGIVAVASWQA